VHDHLRTLEPGPQGRVNGNGMEGTSTGLEAWGGVQLTPQWRLSLGGTLLDQELRLKPGSGDTGVAAAGNDPERQFLLRSSHDLGGERELEVVLRYVGALRSPEVPSYTALDIRYAWRVRPGLDLSVAARNLLDEQHPEFGAAATRSEIERSVFARLTWRP
jgi:iron complex outermembrane receptor protein